MDVIRASAAPSDRFRHLRDALQRCFGPAVAGGDLAVDDRCAQPRDRPEAARI
jgi:hypothetical protein